MDGVALYFATVSTATATGLGTLQQSNTYAH